MCYAKRKGSSDETLIIYGIPRFTFHSMCVGYFWVRVPALLWSNCQAYVLWPQCHLIWFWLAPGLPGTLSGACVAVASVGFNGVAVFYISSSFHNIFPWTVGMHSECGANDSIDLYPSRANRWNETNKRNQSTTMYQCSRLEWIECPRNRIRYQRFPRRRHAMWVWSDHSKVAFPPIQ